MTDATDTRDRVIKLEADLEHMSRTVNGMAAKVDQMHELLQQAKGARWVIIGAATIGGAVSAKLATLLPWLQIGPR